MPLTEPGPRSPAWRRQLSLFGVEAADPVPADLAGLLAGPGRLSRMGGTARIAVLVDAAWRVHVLAAELAVRGIEVSWRRLAPEPPPGPADEGVDPEVAEDADPAAGGAADPEAAGDADPAAGGGPVPDPGDTAGGPAGTGPAERGFEVRTAYSSLLAPLANTRRAIWLNGPRLRLWTAAAGRCEAGVCLLGAPAEPARDAVGAALARIGLPARLVGDPAVYRITGRRRLARLAELVGDRPAAAPPGAWPTTGE